MKKSVHVFESSGGNTLEYCQYGSGKKVLICFPGFGETHESFENLARHLIEYTLTAINLYGVGFSKRSISTNYLRSDEWNETLSELLTVLDIKKFSVLGFSLGGRFAISTFSSFYERMDNLILVASDGIVKRYTYQFSTSPIVRPLFRFLMNNPSPYFLLVDIMQALRLINPYVANFSKTQMHDGNRRRLVYYSWITFKFLRLPLLDLAALINSSKCTVTLIFGEKDKIISRKRHQAFLSKLTKSKLFILPYGHNKLVNNATTEIKKHLR